MDIFMSNCRDIKFRLFRDTVFYFWNAVQAGTLSPLIKNMEHVPFGLAAAVSTPSQHRKLTNTLFLHLKKLNKLPIIMVYLDTHLDHIVGGVLPLVVTGEHEEESTVTEHFPPPSYLDEDFPSTAAPLPHPLTWQASPPTSLLFTHAEKPTSSTPSTMNPALRIRKLGRCHHLSLLEALSHVEDQEHCSRCHPLLCVPHLLHLEGTTTTWLLSPPMPQCHHDVCCTLEY